MKRNYMIAIAVLFALSLVGYMVADTTFSWSGPQATGTLTYTNLALTTPTITGGSLAGDGLVATTTSADGASMGLIARASIDGATDGAIGTNGLGVTIPDNAVVIGGYIDITSALIGSNANRAISFELNGSDDIYASASNTFVGAGINAIVPVFTAASAVKMTNDMELSIVLDMALTNGAGTVVIYYDLLAR